MILPHHITYAVSSIYFTDYTILDINIMFEFWVILGVGGEFLYDSCAVGVHRFLTKLCYSSSSFHNASTYLVFLVLEYGLVMRCQKNIDEKRMNCF